MDSKKLFHVSELSPAAYTKAGRVNIHYTLTLILGREGKDLLYFASPGFRPSLPRAIDEIDSVIEFFFRMCLSACFNRKNFRLSTCF